MRKYLLLTFIMILPLLLLSFGCKALSVDGNGNGDEINVVGTWIFTNVLQTNSEDVHTRTFVLTGDKNAGTVSESISGNTSGTYTVTDNQFRMDLKNFDASYRWTHDYEGTITDNHTMSGTMKTTTYPPTGDDVVWEGTYNYTAERKSFKK